MRSILNRIVTVFFLVMLCGCSLIPNRTKDANDRYFYLIEMLNEHETFSDHSRYFSIEAEMAKIDNGYRYYIIIDEPQLAMYDIEVMAIEKDVDYMVKDGQVLIIDSFTGRAAEGRKFSDGLHQAIEAKENVKVKRESRTLATITFQNFFNKYKKKAGMTGTSVTEEEEFREILISSLRSQHRWSCRPQSLSGSRWRITKTWRNPQLPHQCRHRQGTHYPRAIRTSRKSSWFPGNCRIRHIKA